MKPFLIVYLACVTTAFSQNYTGSNPNAPVRLDLAGSYGGRSFLNIPSTITANVNLTPTTILYNSYSITSSTSPVLTLTQQFPVQGTFEFRTITTTLTLQPFVLSLNNFGPASLQYAGFGSTFNISPLQGFADVQFQGTYQISGPNETVTGTFSVVLPPLSVYRSMPNQAVNVAGYPQSVDLSGTPLFSGTSTVFSGIVDGVALNIHADGFSFQSDPHIGVAQVPPPAPVIHAAGATIASESCSPTNMTLDPGEMVTVNLSLTNDGKLATTSLVGALQASGGVISPSGPQTYGIIAPGATITKSFTFMVDPLLGCGSTVTLTLQLSDNGNPLPSVSYSFATGALTTLWIEDFDGVNPPGLPPGWTADQGVNPGGWPLWVTSNSGLPAPAADSAPNSAYTLGPATRLDNRLYSPLLVYQANSQLIFRHSYNLQQSSSFPIYARDAGVLEMNVNGTGWEDILAAGGVFMTGGYDHVGIDDTFNNHPLGPQRPNWSGISNHGAGGFETCAIKLPASVLGQPVQFRWRMGSDATASSNGWRVDNVSIAQGVCCNGILAVSVAVSRKNHGGTNFDVELPLTGPVGIEPRAGGATNDYTIVVTFNSNVSVNGSPQAEVVAGTGTVGSGGVANGGMVTATGNTVTIALTGVTSQQTIQVRLNSVNGSTNFTIPMGVLVGDSSGNGFVNSGDATITRSHSGRSADLASFRTDNNVDGVVNSADVTIVRARAGNSIP